MPVITDLEHLPEFRNPVITIGSFDGVHHGHKIILQQVVEEAGKINGESVLLTFDPHPRKILHPEKPLGLLTSPKQKTKLITNLGIDNIVIIPFSREFSMMSAQDYIDHFLWENFHPKVIVLGYDHRFGHSREGGIDLLREKLSPQVKISEIPEQLIDDAAVSSTKIRQALNNGDVEVANDMLERPFSFSGNVVRGDRIGHELGFPTANLQLECPDILIPKYGVYVVRVGFENRFFPGMMSIGVRPTINDKQVRTIEVNILDFDEDLYGQSLQIQFLHYLREEEKCNSREELIALIAKDDKNTRTFFARNPKWL